MPRGDKSKYTDKQERKADHIAEGYEQKGVPEKEAEHRAWATVNKDDGGGKEPAAPAAANRPAIRRRTRRRHRRRAFRPSLGRRSVGFGQEGGRHPQAQCRTSRAHLEQLLNRRLVSVVE